MELLVFADLADDFVFCLINRLIDIFGLGGRTNALTHRDEIYFSKPYLTMLCASYGTAYLDFASRMIGILSEGLFYEYYTVL